MPTVKQLYHGRAGLFWNGTLDAAQRVVVTSDDSVVGSAEYLFYHQLICLAVLSTLMSFLLLSTNSSLLLSHFRNDWSCLAVHCDFCFSLWINSDTTINGGMLLEVFLLLFWLALRR